MKTYLASYTRNGKTESGIYYGSAGIDLFNRESFCCDDYNIVSFTISGKNYKDRQESARDIIYTAADVNVFPDLSYSEYMTLADIFENIGRKYGLIKELKENGIL